jgi:hypothetical protein
MDTVPKHPYHFRHSSEKEREEFWRMWAIVHTLPKHTKKQRDAIKKRQQDIIDNALRAENV